MQTKGVNVSSTINFIGKAGDMWCIDVMKTSPKIRNDWVEDIGNAIKAHKELTHKMKVVSEKRKSMVNNRFGGNLSQMVKPSVPDRRLKSASVKKNSTPVVPNRAQKKRNSIQKDKSNLNNLIIYCPKCSQKVKAIDGRSILQCHNCNSLFVLRSDEPNSMHVPELIVHHGMLEYKGKTIYALLTSTDQGGMLRWFKSQETLVNGGCKSCISKVQLSSNVFVKHDDAACRKIAQGGLTIETSSKNSPARLGNKVSLLRQRYERRAKTVSFASMNKQSRDIWVNHIIQVVSSNSGIEEPQDLLTGSPPSVEPRTGGSNAARRLSFADRMQMGEDPSKVIAEMYGRRE